MISKNMALLAVGAGAGALAVSIMWRLSVLWAASRSSPATAPVAGLAGLRILLTGGTSGIGAASVRLLRAGGARVVFCGRRASHGAAIEAAVRERTSADTFEPGPLALFVPADIRDVRNCSALITRTEAVLGGVDVLVNCAGVVISGSVAAGTNEEAAAAWEESLQTNLLAAVWCTRAVLPGMRARGCGTIVNVCSDWAIVGCRGYAAYAASKAALLQLTRCTALEHASEGIRANALCPGDTAVERWRTEGYARGGDGPVSDSQIASDGACLPLGRVATVDEVAQALAFLVARGSEAMTGAALVIDGGNTAA